MRSFLILLCLILMPFRAYAQNVEDAKLDDSPAIAVPAAKAAPKAALATAAAKTPAASKVENTKIEDAQIDDSSAISPAPTPRSATNAAPASVAATPAPPAENPGDAPDDGANAPSVWNIGASFRPAFMQHALVAALLAAMLCGTLGVYVVLRRVVFVGVALAELSSAGIALGLLTGIAPIIGALACMGVGVVVFSCHPASRRLPRDAFVGIVYLLSSALGVLMVAKSAQGETFMLKLLEGDVLTVDMSSVWLLVGAGAVIGALHLAFGKEFVLVSFDREAASTLGLRSALWDFLLMLSIGAAIAVSIHAAGVLFTASMLVLPAATALLFAPSLRKAWLLAPCLAAVPVVLGLHLSMVVNVPASAMSVVLMFLLFLVALVAKRA